MIFSRLGKSHLDIESPVGSQFLYDDLAAYMQMRGVLDLEKRTASNYTLNPRSGEWLKALRIVMAEMGLLDFKEKKPRTRDIFQGAGCKEKRKRYIIARLAFVQSFFQSAGFNKVQLFRGMQAEGALLETPRTLLSATFNPAVGKSFAGIDRNKKITYSYVVKFTYPIEHLFMTYFETKEFNERYREQEAVVFYRTKFTF